MKQLQPHSFSSDVCRRELDELGALLQQQQTLSEHDDVLPFFKTRHDLSVLIALYSPDVMDPDTLAHEFPIGGHFRADLIVGDTTRHQYLLVEFEDGTADGLFARRRRSTLEWSPRFEHAFSQVVDWFWVLEDARSTQEFQHVFGSRDARFHGLIVIGKGMALGPREKSRLSWRTDRVVVDSHKVSCVSFDGLHGDLDFRLRKYYGK